MKNLFTICVYGNFKEKDIRTMIFQSGDSRQYTFQNVLKEAGYDAELFSVNDEAVPFLQEKQKELSFEEMLK